jgi:hypothetical protein
MSQDSKYIVCPSCNGEGTHGPGFVWTQSDMEQEDPDEFADMQRALRRGDFDTPCDFCKGQRVVLAVDEDGFSAAERYQDALDYEAEVRAEQRYCGSY